MSSRLVALVALLAAGLPAAAPADAAGERVGVNAAVNTDANGTPPNAATRKLVIGQEVVHNERIVTDAKGQTQILFLDGSSVSIGPNADLVIDEFIYDPATGTGKMTLTAVRGAMRFVGGKLSKQENAVTLHIGTATIGVRGGVFVADIQPNGKAEVVFVYGKAVTVSGQSGCAQSLYRPGFAVDINGPGGCPDSPHAAPPGTTAAILNQLDGRAGASGGATTVPTDQTVANSPVPNTVSNNIQVSIQQAGANAPTAQPPAPMVSPPQVPTNQIQVASSQSQPVVSNPQPPQPPPQPPPPSIGLAGSFDNTSIFPGPTVSPLQNTSLSNGTLNASVSSGGQQATFALPLPAGRLTTLPPAGIDAGVNGVWGPLTGDTFLSADQSFFYADLISASFNAPNFLGPSLLVGGTAVPSSFFAPTGSTRIFAFNLPQAPPTITNFTGVNTLPFFLNDDGLSDPTPSVSPLYLVAPAANAIGDSSGSTRFLQASLSLTGAQSGQNSALMLATGTVGTLQNGGPLLVGALRGVNAGESYFSPISSIPDGNGNSLYGTSSGIAGFGLNSNQYVLGSNGIATPGTAGPGNGTLASETEGPSTFVSNETFPIAQPAVATTLPAGIGASRSVNALVGFFGGIMTTTATTPISNSFPNAGGNAYAINGIAAIGTNPAANTVTAAFASFGLQSPATGGVNSVTMVFGPEQSAFVDDKNFGAVESRSVPSQINGQNVSSSLYMVTANTAPPPTSFLPTQSICSTCGYLQWGYWGGDLTSGNPASPTRVDHGDINFWVAGQLTPVSQLPTVGTGTYSGGIAGTVVNNGATYAASGSFTNTYNFANASGMFSGTFDTHNFNGAVAGGTANGIPGYAGTITGDNGGKTATVVGAFFGPGAAETAGTFAAHSVANTSYTASGIFGGKLTGPIH
jgi:hypothetical protein